MSSTGRKKVVVAYDVIDDRNRRRLREYLSEFGVSVNRSVFECELTQKELSDLNSDVYRIINPDEDIVVVYPLCRGCFDKRSYAGIKPFYDVKGPSFIT